MALSKKAQEKMKSVLAGDPKYDALAKEILAKISAPLASVAPIATPASATAEDCANKINEVIAALS